LWAERHRYADRIDDRVSMIGIAGIGDRLAWNP
jgi:hypothetical protein